MLLSFDTSIQAQDGSYPVFSCPQLFLIMDSKKRSTIFNVDYFPPGSYRRKLKQQLLYAGVANVAAKTLLAPLERWRIIAQTQYTYLLRPKQFKNFFDYISRIPKQQGFFSLWRSNMTYCWVYLYQTIFQVAIFDAINSTRKQFLTNSEDFPVLAELYTSLLFPLAASTASLAVIYPLDTYRVHTAMSYHKGKENALFRKFRERISQVGSFKEMYKGFWMGNLISLINFNFYRHMGAVLGQIEVDGVPKELTNTQNLLAILAVALVHPLDTVKKSLQLNNMSKPPLFPGYRLFFKVLNQKKVTMSVLYNGFTASIVRTTLFMPLYWAIHRAWTQEALGQE